MEIKCSFNYTPRPVEPNQYLRFMKVDVLCPVENSDDYAVAAQLHMDHLDMSRPFNESWDIYDICDSDSSGWEAVFVGLFEPGTQAEWRKDFGCDEVINSVLFMYKAVFHPALVNWQQFIIDHVAGLVGEDSVFVMWDETTDLDDRQQSDLGFRVAAGTGGLRFRVNCYKNKYSSREDARDVNDLEVPLDAQAYVEKKSKEQPPPPDQL